MMMVKGQEGNGRVSLLYTRTTASILQDSSLWLIFTIISESHKSVMNQIRTEKVEL